MNHRRARPKGIRFADLSDLALSPPWHDEPEPPARSTPSTRPVRRGGWDRVSPPVDPSSEHAQITAARLNGGRPGGALPVEPSSGPAANPSGAAGLGEAHGPGVPAERPPGRMLHVVLPGVQCDPTLSPRSAA